MNKAVVASLPTDFRGLLAHSSRARSINRTTSSRITVTLQVTVRDDDPEAVNLLRNLVGHLADSVDVTVLDSGALGRAPSAPRPMSTSANAIIDGQTVWLDAAARTAMRDGQEVTLCRREFDLLLFFATHPHQVFTRNQLLHAVWGDAFSGPRTIDVHVTRLRSKLRTYRPLIVTVRGVGYRLANGASIAVTTEQQRGGTSTKAVDLRRPVNVPRRRGAA